MQNHFIHTLQEGMTLHNGDYRIERILAQGGFGITYLATHSNELTNTKEKVVIKEFFMSGCFRNGTEITSGTLQNDNFEKFKESFLDEARTLYRFRNHPNIVNVHRFFRENGSVYFVMDFIGGGTLEELAEKEPNNRLSETQVRKILFQTGEALKVLHQENTLHRDIKPQNILRTAEGETYILIDFGIAREFITDKTTLTSNVIITKGYAPPEQYDKQTKRGAYTDIYALAATAYRLLTGTKPIDAIARLNDDIVSPKTLVPTISTELDAAIMKAMALRSKDRYQHIADFLGDINFVDADETLIFDDKTVVEHVIIENNNNGEDETVVFEEDKIIHSEKESIISVDNGNNKDKKEEIIQEPNKESNRTPIFIGVSVLLFFLVALGLKIINKKTEFVDDAIAQTDSISSIGMSTADFIVNDSTNEEVATTIEEDNNNLIADNKKQKAEEEKRKKLEKEKQRKLDEERKRKEEEERKQKEYLDSFKWQDLEKFESNKKYGFRHKETKKTIISCQYTHAFSFSEGLASVSNYGKWGYVDKSGKTVIPLQYDYAFSFSNGIAQVTIIKGLKKFYINKKGECVQDCP